MAAAAILDKFQMAIYLQLVVRSGYRVRFSETADLMALFSIRQIQDGGDRRHLG